MQAAVFLLELVVVVIIDVVLDEQHDDRRQEDRDKQQREDEKIPQLQIVTPEQLVPFKPGDVGEELVHTGILLCLSHAASGGGPTFVFGGLSVRGALSVPPSHPDFVKLDFSEISPRYPACLLYTSPSPRD